MDTTTPLQPTAQEQYMLELVNRARSNPNAEAERLDIDLNQGLANGTINSSAKQPLAFNFDLIESSRAHSQWMLDNNEFSHTGAGGSSAGDRIRQAGYEFTGSWTWGENIAYQGSTAPTIDATATIADEHDGLFTSSGHRTNILSDNFREIGIGAIEGQFTSRSGTTFNALMTTQNFARSGSDVFLTGVAFTDAVVDDDFYTVGEGLGGITVTAINTATNQEFTTQTYDSGGYQLSLEPGTYEIDFSGGSLGHTDVAEQTVTIDYRNVKIDLATDQLSTLAPNLEPDTAPPTEPPVEETEPSQPGDTMDDPADEVPAEEAPVNETPLEDSPTTGDNADPTDPTQVFGNNLIEGTDNSDRLRGTAEADQIQGLTGNDRLFGRAGDDSLVGGAGHDRLRGGRGDDILLGVDATNGGVGEIDLLRGGAGADRFILGDANQAYYNDGQASTWGLDDFAFIRDFNLSQGDTLQLHGEVSDYNLQSLGSFGSALFQGDDELIAIVRTRGNEALALDSNAVQFI